MAFSFTNFAMPTRMKKKLNLTKQLINLFHKSDFLMATFVKIKNIKKCKNKTHAVIAESFAILVILGIQNLCH